MGEGPGVCQEEVGGGLSPSSPAPLPTVHDLLVAPGPTKGEEGQTTGGCMVQGHPNTPEIHSHPERLLLGFAKHGPLIHVRVLWEKGRG